MRGCFEGRQSGNLNDGQLKYGTSKCSLGEIYLCAGLPRSFISLSSSLYPGGQQEGCSCTAPGGAWVPLWAPSIPLCAPREPQNLCLPPQARLSLLFFPTWGMGGGGMLSCGVCSPKCGEVAVGSGRLPLNPSSVTPAAPPLSAANSFPPACLFVFFLGKNQLKKKSRISPTSSSPTAGAEEKPGRVVQRGCTDPAAPLEGGTPQK